MARNTVSSFARERRNGVAIVPPRRGVRTETSSFLSLAKGKNRFQTSKERKAACRVIRWFAAVQRLGVAVSVLTTCRCVYGPLSLFGMFMQGCFSEQKQPANRTTLRRFSGGATQAVGYAETRGSRSDRSWRNQSSHENSVFTPQKTNRA